jgi:integrase
LKKNVYYAQFRNPDTGERLPGRSTGKTDKNDAKLWCDEQLQSGTYISKSMMKLSQYAENWFIWGKCEYIQRKLRLNHNYTQRAAESHRSELDNYILPYFQNIQLSKIRQHHVEAFRSHLMTITGVYKKPLSPKYINNIMSTLSVMIGEAYRLGYIAKDPTKGIGKLGTKDAKPKSFVTDEEFASLFDPSMKEFIWKDNRFYTVNLLAALTGIRQGECLALTVEKILPQHIVVDSSWHRKYGLGPTKTRVTTEPAISAALYDNLVDLAKSSPYADDPKSFIFYGKNAHTPLDHKTILEQLYIAFQKIGISEEQRKERNITFHSWRHFFVTNSRRRDVPDAIIRAAVGHKTVDMTETYTHIQAIHMDQIQQMQEEMHPGKAAYEEKR